MSAQVVAVARHPYGPPVEAIVSDEGPRGVKILRWWGGRAWETLMITDVDELLEHERAYRPMRLELPDDWEDGYLKPTQDSVSFVYGRQPKRDDWEAKRWSRRVLKKVRSVMSRDRGKIE